MADGVDKIKEQYRERPYPGKYYESMVYVVIDSQDRVRRNKMALDV